MNEIDYTKVLLEDQLKFFRKKRNWNRFWALAFIVSSTSLSAIATAAIGISEIFENDIFKVVAISSSGIATVLGVWQGAVNYRKLWHINNVVLARLHKIDRELRRSEVRGELASKAAEIGEELENAIQDADSSWVETYAPESDEAKGK